MKKFDKLSAFLETSSGVTPRVETIKKFIDVLSNMGYDRLYLGMCDSYRIESEPYFGYKRGGYTKGDFNELDSYAKSKKVEIVPQIQVLGHLHYLSKYPVYEQLFDTDSVLLVGDDKVYELIDKMVKTISEGLSTKTIHIGMDETFGLGSGNYLKKNPKASKVELILRHLERVNEILTKYGYEEIEMWGDMIVNRDDDSPSLENIRQRMPKNLSVVAWNYEETDPKKLVSLIDETREITGRVSFAGAVWKYLGFGPNNAYSTNCLLSQMKALEKENIENFIVTLWSDRIAPCSIFEALPSLYAVSQYNYGKIETVKDIDKDVLIGGTNLSYKDWYSFEYLDNPYKDEVLTRSTSSFWGLYSDVFLGNFDTLFPDTSRKKYLELSREYKKLSGKGEFGYLFSMAESLMMVLSEKCDIAKKIRNAYMSKDKKNLKKEIGHIKKLRKRLKSFMLVFERYFLHENIGFGMEAYHQRIGLLITRCDYMERKIKAYIKNDVIIDELEGGIQPLKYDPMPNMSCSMMVNDKLLISYCL